HSVAEAGDLAAVRVFADLRGAPAADGKVLQLRLPRIDDLVRGLRTAGGTGNDVAAADRIALSADPHLTRPFEDEEHLLLHAMAVERKRAFSRRHRGHVVAELLRADLRRDLADAGIESLRRRAGRRALRRP